MSLLVLQHAKSETPGTLGVALQNYGHRLRIVHLYAGDPLPSDLDDIDGVVSLGGPMNVEDTAKHAWIEPEMALLKAAHQASLPVIGICLGAQLIAAALGGKVAAMAAPEVGWHPLKLAFPGFTDPIYTGIKMSHIGFHLHGQEVTALPPGGAPMAGSKACKTQAFKVGLRTYAFQYHFEWNEADLREMVKDELVTKAGTTAEAILAQNAEHYPEYRRLSDRMATNLASFLFPIDKLR
jgi:GMP synthase (glutamine-hydrolysing)